MVCHCSEHSEMRNRTWFGELVQVECPGKQTARWRVTGTQFIRSVLGISTGTSKTERKEAGLDKEELAAK